MTGQPQVVYGLLTPGGRRRRHDGPRGRLPRPPGECHLDRRVRDPAGLSLGEVRTIRADIDARVRALLAELHPADASV